MSGHRPFSELRAKIESDPERRIRSEAYERAMRDVLRLEEVRSQHNQIHEQTAKKLDAPRPSISRVEHEEDIYLSTLRGYIEELGGELEIRAVFPDGKILLTAKSS